MYTHRQTINYLGAFKSLFSKKQVQYRKEFYITWRRNSKSVLVHGFPCAFLLWQWLRRHTTSYCRPFPRVTQPINSLLFLMKPMSSNRIYKLSSKWTCTRNMFTELHLKILLHSGHTFCGTESVCMAGVNQYGATKPLQVSVWVSTITDTQTGLHNFSIGWKGQFIKAFYTTPFSSPTKCPTTNNNLHYQTFITNWCTRELL
jgi:hypothetical protein